MANRLFGKTCIVTGAGQGIGRAIAEACHAEGGVVVAIDMQPESLSEWTAASGIQSVVMDVTDQSDVLSLAKKYDETSVLINCVGVVAVGSILESDASELERSFRINVGSMANMIQAFLPGMRSRKNGAIVNIASVVSSIKAAPDRFVYTTTKAAVIGLTKSVAMDFIKDGIRCNAICPGTVESPSLHQRMANQSDPKAALEAFVARQPMGRIGTPEEIANISVLLASDEVSFMSGTTLVIDGGMSL